MILIIITNISLLEYVVIFHIFPNLVQEDAYHDCKKTSYTPNMGKYFFKPIGM